MKKIACETDTPRNVRTDSIDFYYPLSLHLVICGWCVNGFDALGVSNWRTESNLFDTKVPIWNIWHSVAPPACLNIFSVTISCIRFSRVEVTTANRRHALSYFSYLLFTLNCSLFEHIDLTYTHIRYEKPTNEWCESDVREWMNKFAKWKVVSGRPNDNVVRILFRCDLNFCSMHGSMDTGKMWCGMSWPRRRERIELTIRVVLWRRKRVPWCIEAHALADVHSHTHTHKPFKNKRI